MDKNKYHVDENTFQAASSGDCTGLIPARPEDPEELEFYDELYNYLPPGGADVLEQDEPEILPESYVKRKKVAKS